MNGKSGTTPLLKGVSTHGSKNNFDELSESKSLHFTNFNLFKSSAEVSMTCPDDAAMCKSVEQFHPGANKEISLYSIEKSKGPLFFNFTVFLGPYLVNYWWFTPRQRREPVPISQFLDTLQQVDILQVPIIPDSVNGFAVLKSYLYFPLETKGNLETKHIFRHCHKVVYSKHLEIIWKHGDEFFKFIPF